MCGGMRGVGEDTQGRKNGHRSKLSGKRDWNFEKRCAWGGGRVLMGVENIVVVLGNSQNIIKVPQSRYLGKSMCS